jgi:hypothetical protein
MYPRSGENVPDITQYAKYINWFCKQDIDTHTSHLKLFDFIDDDALKTRIAKEFYVARYMSKLQYVFRFTWNQESFELFGCLKLQIVQYGGIFEAIISHFLEKKYFDDDAVKKITQGKGYKKIDGLSNGVTVKQGDRELFLCFKDTEPNRWESIKFESKLKAAVTIGLMSEKIKVAVLEIYNLRNSVHIQAAAKKAIEFEIEHCRSALYTLLDFLEEIRTFLEYSETPEIKEEEERIKSEFEESINSLNQETQTNPEIFIDGLIY